MSWLGVILEFYLILFIYILAKINFGSCELGVILEFIGLFSLRVKFGP